MIKRRPPIVNGGALVGGRLRGSNNSAGRRRQTGLWPGWKWMGVRPYRRMGHCHIVSAVTCRGPPADCGRGFMALRHPPLV